MGGKEGGKKNRVDPLSSQQLPAPRPSTLFFFFFFLGRKYREGDILHAACARTVDQEKSLPDPNRVRSGRAMYSTLQVPSTSQD